MKKVLFILSALLIITGCSVESASSYKPNQPLIYSDGLIIDGITYEKTGEVLVIDKEVTIEGKDKEGAFLEGKTVTVKPFYICKYEVTQELYELITGTNPSKFKTAVEGEKSNLLPVESITWYDAVNFCVLLNEKLNLQSPYKIEIKQLDENNRIVDANVIEYENVTNGFRLPTGIEWEFAARGGDPLIENWNYSLCGVDANTKKTDWYKNEDLFDFLWSYGNSKGTTHEIGLKIPNNLILYDMSGNVWEWCFDIREGRDSRGKWCVTRESRGGSVRNYQYLEVKKSNWFDDRSESSFWYDLGFRLCRSYIPEN